MSSVLNEATPLYIIKATDGSGAVLGSDGNIIVARDAEGNMVLTSVEGSAVVVTDNGSAVAILPEGTYRHPGRRRGQHRRDRR